MHDAVALTVPPRPGRGRRPSRQVRDEIVAAAGALVLAEGMAGFTVGRVAALAGASKMTIYKWWPSRGVLALEGCAASVNSVFAMPDTGNITADLTTHLTTFVRVLRDTPTGRVLRELLGQAQTDPELAAAFRSVYLEPRRAVALAALRAAQERGHLRADVDHETLIDQLWGVVIYRLLTGYQPLTDEFVHGLVRNVRDVIRPVA